MKLNRALVLTRKDWEEIFDNKLTLLSIILPYTIPIGFFIIMTVADKVFNIKLYEYISDEAINTLRNIYPTIVDMDLHKMFYYVICIFIIPMLFMVFSLASISIITADSFAGEKERKTVEALFVSPLSDSELFLGKILASFIPSVTLLYIFFIITVIIVNLTTSDFFGFLWYPPIEAGLIVFLVTPFYTFLGMTLVIWGSSRASTVRDASNYAGLLILPFLFFVLTSLIGLVVINLYNILLVALLLLIIDIVSFYICFKMFDRERLIIMP